MGFFGFLRCASFSLVGAGSREVNKFCGVLEYTFSMDRMANDSRPGEKPELQLKVSISANNQMPTARNSVHHTASATI